MTDPCSFKEAAAMSSAPIQKGWKIVKKCAKKVKSFCECLHEHQDEPEPFPEPHYHYRLRMAATRTDLLEDIDPEPEPNWKGPLAHYDMVSRRLEQEPSFYATIAKEKLRPEPLRLLNRRHSDDNISSRNISYRSVVLIGPPATELHDEKDSKLTDDDRTYTSPSTPSCTSGTTLPGSPVSPRSRKHLQPPPPPTSTPTPTPRGRQRHLRVTNRSAEDYLADSDSSCSDTESLEWLSDIATVLFSHWELPPSSPSPPAAHQHKDHQLPSRSRGRINRPFIAPGERESAYPPISACPENSHPSLSACPSLSAFPKPPTLSNPGHARSVSAPMPLPVSSAFYYPNPNPTPGPMRRRPDTAHGCLGGGLADRRNGSRNMAGVGMTMAVPSGESLAIVPPSSYPSSPSVLSSPSLYTPSSTPTPIPIPIPIPIPAPVYTPAPRRRPRTAENNNHRRNPMAQAVASGESLWVNRRPSTSRMRDYGERERAERVPPVPLPPRSYTPSSVNTEAPVLRVGDGAAVGARLGARRREREREAERKVERKKAEAAVQTTADDDTYDGSSPLCVL